MSALLQMLGITKNYNQEEILHGIDLSINYGEIIAITGPSGSGKSTLLQIAGLVDKPTKGEVLYESKLTNLMSDNQLTSLRLDCFGFVYQFHHLLPEFTVIENLMIPQWVRKHDKQNDKVLHLLKLLGLEDKASSMPDQLSGGEQQRVAIARSLVNGPRIIFADEPTGNLDTHNTEEVWKLFYKEIKQEGRAMIITTHNLDLARRCDRIFVIRDGLLEECNETSL